MKTKAHHRLPRRAAWSMLCAALALVACGGGGVVDAADSAATATAATGTTTTTASPTQAAATSRLLLAEDGLVLQATPYSVPADHGARTRPGLYAQREQALQLERTLRGAVIWVDVACCGTEGADLGVLIAFGMQAAGNLPASVPVFVGGADLRLAASVVNRLAEAGLSRVFLLTPARSPGTV